MKKVVLVLALLVMGFTVSVSAQKSFAGRIHYKISVEGTDDPNFLAQMTEGSDVIIFGNKTKTVMNMQGVGITNITDGDARFTMTVIEITGMGKYYVELPADSIEKKHKNQQCDVTYLDETKDIAGYKCKKAEVVITDLETDENETMILWVSDDFNAMEAINFGSPYSCLKGFPLRSETSMDYDGNKITIITEATEIKADKKIKAFDFMRPSDAKDLMQDPDMRKMLGM